MVEILEEWCKFSGFDPSNPNKNNKLHFTFGDMFNTSQEIEKRNTALCKFIQNWDDSGVLSTIYAKYVCKLLLEKTEISLLDALNDKERIASASHIWSKFNSVEFKNVCSEFYTMLRKFLDNLSDTKRIGELGESDEQPLFDALEKVILDCNKLKIETYSKGNTIKINNVYPYVIVVDSLSECLVKLTNSNDGLYICYIANNWKIDGWFGFFIKSGNNLISINERLSEAYKGQHSCSRNDRYAEDKCYNLFPYEIVEFEGSDYKGYPTAAKITEDKIHILQTKSALNLAVTMFVIYKKYNNTQNTITQVYVDSLLPVNVDNELKLLESKSLVPVEGTHSLLLVQKEVCEKIKFTNEEILTNSVGDEFNWNTNKSANYDETGAFHGMNQKMVDLFGYGFEQQPFLKCDRLLLGTSNTEGYAGELVGTPQRMRMLAYYDARKQLAKHIEKNIQREFIEFGGKVEVQNWFVTQCKEHFDNLIEIAVEAEVKKNFGDIYSVPVNSPFRVIKYKQETSGYRYQKIPKYDGTVNNNVRFVIKFLSAEAFNIAFGEDNVPKIMSVYKFSRNHDGNSLLDATDMVSQVKMPYEPPFGSFYTPGSNYVDFTYEFAISQRDLSKLVTQYKHKQGK